MRSKKNESIIEALEEKHAINYGLVQTKQNFRSRLMKYPISGDGAKMEKAGLEKDGLYLNGSDASSENEALPENIRIMFPSTVLVLEQKPIRIYSNYVDPCIAPLKIGIKLGAEYPNSDARCGYDLIWIRGPRIAYYLKVSATLQTAVRTVTNFWFENLLMTFGFIWVYNSTTKLYGYACFRGGNLYGDTIQM